MISVLCFNFYLPVSSEDNALNEGQSNIVNGGFEEPDLKNENPTKKWTNAAAADVPGWATTSTDGIIEFGWMLNGASEHMVPTTVTEIVSGAGASDGVQFAEVVADEASSLYQSLSLNAGYNYGYTDG